MNKIKAQARNEWSRTYKRLKDRFLIERNRTKRAHFRGSPLFSSYVQHKNRRKNKQTEKLKQLIQLILCHLDAGGWQNEWSNILPKSSQARKKPPPSISLRDRTPRLFSDAPLPVSSLMALPPVQLHLVLASAFRRLSRRCRSAAVAVDRREV